MSQKSVPIEIDLRGACLKVSVTLEMIVMNIIYASNDEQYFVKDSPYLKVKNFTFAKKVERLKKLLETFHPDLLVQHSKTIKMLSEFGNLRNQMAHCVFEWKDSLSDFNIFDVAEENGFQYFKPYPGNVDSIKAEMIEALKISTPLKNVLDEVSYRLKKKNPAVFAQLKLG